MWRLWLQDKSDALSVAAGLSSTSSAPVSSRTIWNRNLEKALSGRIYRSPNAILAQLKNHQGAVITQYWHNSKIIKGQLLLSTGTTQKSSWGSYYWILTQLKNHHGAVSTQYWHNSKIIMRQLLLNTGTTKKSSWGSYYWILAQLKNHHGAVSTQYWHN